MTPAVILIIISLLFSFFFSGMEVAFVSSNKVRIDLDAQNHTVIGRILTLFTRHQRQFITTLLVGNNIALVIFGISIATLTRPLIAPISAYDFLLYPHSSYTSFYIRSLVSRLVYLTVYCACRE